jgi:hypothetical protein
MKLRPLWSIVAAVLFLVPAGFTAAASLPDGVTAVPLAAITNDRDSSVSNIELMLSDDGDVRGIYLATRANAAVDPSQASGQVYPLAGIESEDGVVLGQGKGVKAILLRGTIAPQSDHGSLVIRYLTNGVFKHYAQCRVELKRSAPGDWQLVNAYNGQPVKHIEVQTWALGISTIGNICPAQNA